MTQHSFGFCYDLYNITMYDRGVLCWLTSSFLVVVESVLTRVSLTLISAVLLGTLNSHNWRALITLIQTDRCASVWISDLRKRKPHKIHLTEPFPGACCRLCCRRSSNSTEGWRPGTMQLKETFRNESTKGVSLLEMPLHPYIGEEWSKIDVFMQRTGC